MGTLCKGLECINKCYYISDKPKFPLKNLVGSRKKAKQHNILISLFGNLIGNGYIVALTELNFPCKWILLGFDIFFNIIKGFFRF